MSDEIPHYPSTTKDTLARFWIGLSALISISFLLVLHSDFFDLSETPLELFRYAQRESLIAALLVAVTYFVALVQRTTPKPNLGAVARLASTFITSHCGLLLTFETVCFTLWLFLGDRIAFGEGAAGLGYGYDGLVYGFMSERPFDQTRALPYPFCHRILAPFLAGQIQALCHSIFSAWQVLQMACYLVSVFFLIRIARYFKCNAPTQCLTVALFTCAKFGTCFWFYYPVLTDGIGTAFALMVWYATLRERFILASMLLAVGVLGREQLLLVAPLPLVSLAWGYLQNRQQPLRGIIGALLSFIAPIVMVSLLSRFPPVPCIQTASFPYLLFERLQAFISTPELWLRYVLAMVSVLGILPFLLLYGRPTLHPTVVWAIVSGLLFGTFGGGDLDRFVGWTYPFQVIAASSVLYSLFRRAPLLAALLISLHLFVQQCLMVKPPSEAFYYSIYAAYSSSVVNGTLILALRLGVFTTLVVGILCLAPKQTHPQEL